MVQYIPAPNTRELLPPILACLPLAYFSPRPPPALFPLLSPILRQRVSLLSWSPNSDSTNSRESWLRLLCWDSEIGSRLPEVVKDVDFEPHPVSGEIELQNDYETEYRRLDGETLHSKIKIDDYNLCPVFLWCTNEEGSGNGWKLAELRPLEDETDGREWFETMTEATDAFERSTFDIALQGNGHENDKDKEQQRGNDNEDDYWAAYDRTPDRTPAPHSTRGPSNPMMEALSQQRKRSTSELEYFARYAQEVQPAMDPHDPDEERTQWGGSDSTLNGNVLSLQTEPQTSQDNFSMGAEHVTHNGAPDQHADRSHTASGAQAHAQPDYPDESLLSAHPEAAHSPFACSPPAQQSSRAASGRGNPSLPMSAVDAPSSSGPPPVQSSTEDPVPPPAQRPALAPSMLRQHSIHISQAELAIKQHVSTDLKSLYRLARGVGIQRAEFEALVRTELEFLRMMERDE